MAEEQSNAIEEEKKMREKDKALTSEQTYDSALATMITRFAPYIIPLVNEVFGEKFTKAAKVEIREGVDKIMRGYILKTKADEWLEEAHEMAV